MPIPKIKYVGEWEYVAALRCKSSKDLFMCKIKIDFFLKKLHY